jgi:FkbM family methyltransferase
MAMLQSLKQMPAARAIFAGPIAVRSAIRKRLDHSGASVLDRLSRDAVGDIVLSVSEFDGKFTLSPSSDLFRRILRNGSYEPELASLFRKHVNPSKDIIDVGANIGFFTVLGAKLTAGRVLAVEPTKAAAQRLQHNIELNSVAERVILFKGVVSNSSGEETINVINGREEYSSIGNLIHPSAAGAVYEQERVTSMSVDDLVEQFNLQPGLIKIDVEGAEGKVYSGANHTLATYRPIIISELSEALLRPMGSSAVEIVRNIERLGYLVIDPLNPKQSPGTKAFGDILAIPVN